MLQLRWWWWSSCACRLCRCLKLIHHLSEGRLTRPGGRISRHESRLVFSLLPLSWCWSSLSFFLDLGLSRLASLLFFWLLITRCLWLSRLSLLARLDWCISRANCSCGDLCSRRLCGRCRSRTNYTCTRSNIARLGIARRKSNFVDRRYRGG